ncbi:hypothetical protein FXO38_22305 [Capsicum annuum]|nr:hypothetical protein FXO38_22305 [Capsicum annuum]KAF3645803.1 hypothetical protein FXO37_20782 [Capsicum annuum]
MDGVSKENPGRSSWAFSLRDTNGYLVHAEGAAIEDTNPMESEAWVILQEAIHCNGIQWNKLKMLPISHHPWVQASLNLHLFYNYKVKWVSSVVWSGQEMNIVAKEGYLDA